MNYFQDTERLLNTLPSVRGRLSTHVRLDQLTWFGVGGPAQILFKPADLNDLSQFLQNKPKDIPHTIFGVGSNMLIRDGGIQGVVIRLGRGFNTIIRDTDAPDLLHVGAACLDVNVALQAREYGIGGFEFLSGIPGTIGGAIRMNAGAFTKEIKDCLVAAHVLDEQGQLHTLNNEDFRFSYRHAHLPDNWLIIGATLRGEAADAQTIQQRMQEIQAHREQAQPIKSKTGGSTFTNPNGHKAWELIDAAGCRGLQIGQAQVSSKHCNFLINLGQATANDLERLGEYVREKVLAHSGISLNWEIIRLGLPLT